MDEFFFQNQLVQNSWNFNIILHILQNSDEEREKMEEQLRKLREAHSWSMIFDPSSEVCSLIFDFLHYVYLIPPYSHCVVLIFVFCRFHLLLFFWPVVNQSSFPRLCKFLLLSVLFRKFSQNTRNRYSVIDEIISSILLLFSFRRRFQVFTFRLRSVCLLIIHAIITWYERLCADKGVLY